MTRDSSRTCRGRNIGFTWGSSDFGKLFASHAKFGTLVQFDERYSMVHDLEWWGARCTCSARASGFHPISLAHFRTGLQVRRKGLAIPNSQVTWGLTQLEILLGCPCRGVQAARAGAGTLVSHGDPLISGNFLLATRNLAPWCSLMSAIRWCTIWSGGVHGARAAHVQVLFTHHYCDSPGRQTEGDGGTKLTSPECTVARPNG